MFFFFCKQKTAYEWRISDWSSDVCSSDLARRDDTHRGVRLDDRGIGVEQRRDRLEPCHIGIGVGLCRDGVLAVEEGADAGIETAELGHSIGAGPMPEARSEEHTSELQSRMRISYDVL